VAATTLSPEDLEPFADIPPAKAQAMIEDALALAATVAPCITTDAFPHDAAARAILRRAILRWHDSGSGAITQESIGPYNYSTDTRDARSNRSGLFWPTEIEQLQDLCRGDDSGKSAFAVDRVPTAAVVHADICALRFGAAYCSCGAVLTGSLPLYENLP
jgi:hypothetical protein